MAEEVRTTPILRFGVFELDIRTGELRKSGKLIRLAPQPFRLLVLLAGKPGELVTREEIQREIWGDDTVVDYEQGLSFVIKKARAALGDDSRSPRYIETLPRRGYRFIAPVYAEARPGDFPAADAETEEGDAPPAPPRLRRVWLIGAGLAAVVAVLFVFNVSALHNRIFGPPLPHIHSIAVLPLENLSRNPSQEYFAEGMTDDLITELSKISALRVIARTSTMAYRGSKRPLREIARELDVDAVVEGTVEEVGNRVRINVQLVDPSTDQNLLVASYERDLKDVLRLQGDVAEGIAKKIRVKVTPQEQHRLLAAATVNPAAHDAYLRGWYLFDQRNSAEASRSTQYFRKAIELDPDYASAYAGLSISLVLQSYFAAGRPSDVMPRARAAARHALQLDPDSGEAYTALGAIEVSYDWDWKDAKHDLQRGIQLNPSDPYAEIFYGLYSQALGKMQDAVAHTRRAVKLDPVSFFANRQLASMLYFDRRYNAALTQLERTRELLKGSGVVENWASWAYEEKHLYGKAVRFDLKDLAENGASAADLNFCRAAYARGGWQGYSKARIERILLPIAKRQCVSYFLGVGYAQIGHPAKAFRWLNRAVDQHCIWLVCLSVDPKLDALRSDPRYLALLHRINLPPK